MNLEQINNSAKAIRDKFPSDVDVYSLFSTEGNFIGFITAKGECKTQFYINNNYKDICVVKIDDNFTKNCIEVFSSKALEKYREIGALQ